MRIATWNVNSIGARLPRLLDWLTTREPDAVALQETKAADGGFPYAELATWAIRRCTSATVAGTGWPCCPGSG